MPYIEQEFQGSLILAKIHIQQNSKKTLNIGKVKFRELCDSNLSGLCLFDNMTILRVENKSKAESS